MRADWSALVRELKRPGVNLLVLSEEYRAVHPAGSDLEPIVHGDQIVAPVQGDQRGWLQCQFHGSPGLDVATNRRLSWVLVMKRDTTPEAESIRCFARQRSIPQASCPHRRRPATASCSRTENLTRSSRPLSCCNSSLINGGKSPLPRRAARHSRNGLIWCWAAYGRLPHVKLPRAARIGPPFRPASGMGDQCRSPVSDGRSDNPELVGNSSRVASVTARPSPRLQR